MGGKPEPSPMLWNFVGARREAGVAVVQAVVEGYGWRVVVSWTPFAITGTPLVRSLKDGLWEVRSHLPSQKIARLILCFHQELVVLHAFIKKTQKTPPEDLELAKRR